MPCTKLKNVNTYNIYDEEHYSTVLYSAIAKDENQVEELAEKAGIDLTGLTIELIRRNFKDELGRPYKAKIEDALVC